MKALLITILVVILLIFGYNEYSEYQRFRLDNYGYKTLDMVIFKENDSQTAMLYFQKVEELNGHVITQWSVNNIDVRNPEDDNGATLAARATYDRLLGEVKYLETQILNVDRPIIDVQSMEKRLYQDRIKELFASTSNNTLNIGSRGALVYELQKLLNRNGNSIIEDGSFQNMTFEALKSFENSNNLFPDGKLDMLTLEHLLEQ